MVKFFSIYKICAYVWFLIILLMIIDNNIALLGMLYALGFFVDASTLGPIIRIFMLFLTITFLLALIGIYDLISILILWMVEKIKEKK